jgi:hypothetical protein
VDRVVVVWLDTNEDEIGVHVAYDAGVEKFLADCAAPYRGSLRLGRGSMIFPNRPSSAHRFEVGDVVAAHTDGNVTIRKHSSGSFTALVDGEPKPARQYLIEIRNAMGLSDKATNTTRSLGSQVFGKLGK